MDNNKPVARLIPVSLPDREMLWARTFDEYSQESSESNPYRSGPEIPLYVTPPEVEDLLQQIEYLGLKLREAKAFVEKVVNDGGNRMQYDAVVALAELG